MKIIRIAAFLGCCFFTLVACQTENKEVVKEATPPAVTSPSPAQTTLEEAEWTVLFDGISGANWRSYEEDKFPNKGWTVKNGALSLLAKSGGGDIMTKEEYENFDFRFEFNLEKGANSGILYLVQKIKDKPIYYGAPEYQLIDDEYIIKESKGDESVIKHHLTADNYDLQTATNKKLNPAGQWNAARIVINNGHVEHYLNGDKVVEYDLGSPKWKAMVAGSKFADWEPYGKARKGHIGLQDHGDGVSFRNIKIRKL